jgi:hypothetical protein
MGSNDPVFSVKEHFEHIDSSFNKHFPFLGQMEKVGGFSFSSQKFLLLKEREKKEGKPFRYFLVVK